MGSQATRDETQLLIGGKWVEAGDGTYDIINPATEQVVGQAPNASVDDADAAAAAARRGLPGLGGHPGRGAAGPAEEGGRRPSGPRATSWCPLVIAETGATASVGSRMQVPVSADRFDRYSRDIRHVQESMLPPIVTAATPLAPGGLISALAYRQPVGVVAAIASYNFPLTNMAGKVAPALAMGNTVIMKPAPQDPLAVIELARVLDEVGFPPGVVNLVNSQGPEPASALTTSPDVDMVSFTGSTAVGQRIAAAGAPTMKRLLMELGGKGAAVVFEDADIKAVVTAIGSTWAFHSGQICTAPTRAVVHRSIFDQVVDGPDPVRRRTSRSATPPRRTPWSARSSPAPSSSGSSTTSRPAASEGEVVVGGGRPEHLAHRLLRGAHPDHRDQRHDRGPRGDLRPGGGGHPLRRRGGGHRHRQRLASSASTTTCSPATPPGPSGWPSSSGPATSASTPPSATWTPPSAGSR